MAADKPIIITWLEEAKQAGATHLIVVCDTYDYDDYPVSVMPDENVKEIEASHNKDMKQVMEVYSLTGKYKIADQINEHRAFHYD